MSKHFDIVVIGAGIIGLATAFQIARRADLSITVVEQGPDLGLGSTGASSAVCRHRYSVDNMLTLARDGIAAYRHWPEFLGISDPLARFQNDGVLWLSEGDDSWAKQEQARLNSASINALVLDTLELRERFPAINPCNLPPDLVTGEDHPCNGGEASLFEVDGGYFDPVNALLDLRRALREHQIEIQFNQRVDQVLENSGNCRGVRLANGSVIESNHVINATGPWCNRLLSELNLDQRWKLQPTRIQIIHLNRPREVVGNLPVCCDMVGGIYFRSQNQGAQIVLGSTLEQDERQAVNPDDYDGMVDEEFKQAKLHALHHRIPALPYHGRISGYCGLYTVNLNDVHPIVGETAIRGFHVANGFSGHGFKLAPAIGSILAQTITGLSADFDTLAPLDFLGYDRAPLKLASMNVLA